MFNLLYLSTEDKRALEKLQDRLSRAPTPDVRAQALLDIQEIEAKAKPYQMCDLAEADELKSQILNKINTLARMGKSTQPFLVYLRDVDFLVQRLQMEEAVKVADRFKPEDDPAIRELVTPRAVVRREHRRKEAFGANRWKIGFEDEPEDNQNEKPKDRT